MNELTPEQIAKLPRWAQDHIKDLDRRMKTAERTLTEYTDAQTPSEFYHDDMVCVGGGSPKYIRRYVQTYKMTIERNGVQVTALLRQDEPGIELSFSNANHATAQVAIIASSFNKLTIVPSDKLR